VFPSKEPQLGNVVDANSLYPSVKPCNLEQSFSHPCYARDGSYAANLLSCQLTRSLCRSPESLHAQVAGSTLPKPGVVGVAGTCGAKWLEASMVGCCLLGSNWRPLEGSLLPPPVLVPLPGLRF
jgi:hypothetical protein